MTYLLRLFSFLLFGLALSACAHDSQSIPNTLSSVQAATRSGSITMDGQRVAGTTTFKKLFESAQNKVLVSDADFDPYIDSSITGSDRVLARKLMRLMPASMRGDFVYVDRVNNRLFSNNPAVLQNATSTDATPTPSSPTLTTAAPYTKARDSASSRRSVQYQDGCSPPDPYQGSGPYVRAVSKCGFTGAIGFVNIGCGSSFMLPGDSGYTYFEVTNGPNGSRSEGGLEYYSDNSTGGTTGIAPYYRNSAYGTYTNLNSNGFHYSCGETITIAHGPVNGNGLIYTFTGLPQNYIAAQYWSGTVSSFSNAAWEFDTSPWSNSGTDRVGVPTPCTSCSISEVTSIAQSTGDSDDGAYFGAYLPGDDDIHWQQTGFGEWQSGCEQGAAICWLQYSTNFNNYFGGVDYYYGIPGNPSDVADLDGPSTTGYGPWESYVGIALPDYSLASVARVPAAAYQNPPPLTCAADSYGYCVAEHSGSYAVREVSCISGFFRGQPVYANEYLNTGTINYYVANPSSVLSEYSATYSTYLCSQNTLTWKPSEPKVSTGDPNLP